MKPWQELMFNSDEHICTSNYVEQAHFYPVEQLHKDDQYICLNPLKGPRKDANVAAHRNILFEFDDGTIKSQEEAVALLRLPYTIKTFSGNKSNHYIICLEESLPADQYKNIVKQAYKKFKNIDRSCSNPSRFTRTPGAINTKTGRHQESSWFHKRLPNAEFFDWLGHVEAEVAPDMPKTEPAEGYVPLLNIFTKHYLAFGSEPGRRNSDLFKAACDMFKCGWNESEIFAAAANVADLPFSEIKVTIKSAKRTINK